MELTLILFYYACEVLVFSSNTSLRILVNLDSLLNQLVNAVLLAASLNSKGEERT